ncbi:uncharacterized protein LOC107267611 [Cephus cinctus]|uniref:Uncharacterized protein LOC107267611 n=1 Tax=Cephus cinctus TaxID=211228 RepID=A0AAJ7BV10_CEPCN|nr:uncharacterized protein LOC107267611 [Cephus cinctus]
MDCPPLHSTLYNPKVLWYQNDFEVVIRIMLQDVKSYFIRVELDEFVFSTIIDDKKYCVLLQLYGSVNGAETIHCNLGREIKINLQKAHKYLAWTRLYRDIVKIPHIILDPDHVEPSHDIKKEILSLGYKKLKEIKNQPYNLMNIMPDVPSSDEAESDDECYDALFD